MRTISVAVFTCLLSMSALVDAAPLPRGVAWARVTNDGSVVVQRYSSSGDLISSTKTATGTYYVKFVNNNMFGGVGHVVALRGDRYCNIGRAREFTNDVTVDVRCFSANGQPAASDFVVLFYKEQRTVATADSAYVLADQPTMASYTPTVQWNSRGGATTVAHSRTGSYFLTFPLIAVPRQQWLVSAYESNAHCRVTSGGGSLDTTFLGVECVGPDGAPKDTAFVVSAMNDFLVGRERLSEQRRGANLLNLASSLAEYTPSPTFQATLGSGPLTIRRLAKGEYEVDAPGIVPTTSIAIVTAASDVGYCSLGVQRAASAGGMVIPVSCHAADGTSADMPIYMNILSSDLATSALPAGSGRTRATAWMHVEPGQPPVADPRYQFNPTGGVNSVSLEEWGLFRVRFGGLATAGGIVHVTSSRGFCNAVWWGPHGADLDVTVACFGDGGGTAEVPFNVLFYKEDRGSTAAPAAYARSMIGASDATYAAPTPFAWTGFGQPVQITRTNVGRYSVRFGPGTTPLALQVFASAYGYAPRHCRGAIASAGLASVSCFNASNEFEDTDFGISIFNDLVFGSDPAGPPPTGAVARVHPNTGTYLPDTGYSTNSTGGGASVTRQTEGRYVVDFPGLKPSNRSIALAFANGDPNQPFSLRCQPADWTPTPAGGGTRVPVSCSFFGSPADSIFTVLYLTDSGNGAPEMSPLTDRTVPGGGSSGVIPFTVSDDTDVAAVTITTSSSNPAVVPLSNILVAGTGAQRSMTVITQAGVLGTSVITLTAHDEAGFTVSRSFTMTVATSRSLSVVTTGPGGGIVTSASPGITCGSSCAANFADGAVVTLSATPAAGATFFGWSGAGCTGTSQCAVTMDAAKTVTATFGLPPKTYYLAEGATGAFFDLDVVIANPNDVDVPVEMTFLDAGGQTYPLNFILGAKRTRTVAVETEVPALANAEVSTIVHSPLGHALVVERSLFWDASYYGGHTGSAVDGPQTTWYFGEGFQSSPVFDTFILLANAGNTPAHVTLTFLRQGTTPVTTTKTVPALSRATFWAAELAGELNGQSFSTAVTSDVPIIAERAMYFGTPTFNGGHESAGVSAPATSWFHAEGRTGSFFDTYILIGNPGNTPANVTVRFLRANDTPITTSVVVPAQGRETIHVDDLPGLADVDVSTEVTSDVPVISERSMYWPGDFAQWYEAHNSFGVTSTGLAWGLSEGRFGFPQQFETYILLTNPTATPTRVRVTFLRQGSKAPIVSEQLLAANARANVDMSALQNAPDFDSSGERFGALVESLDNVGIVVERALYFSTGGVFWAGGTNATAVKIR